MAQKNILTITALATALALAGCGGGGSKGYFNTGTGGDNTPTNPGTGGGTTDPTTPTLNKAELLSIGLSKSSLNAGGSDSLTVTIRTLDKLGGIIPNAQIKLAIADAATSGANLSTTTTIVSDENGVATTDLLLANSNLSQRINRTIKLSVTSGDLPAQILEIPVNGTALTITSDVNLLEDGDTATITLTALDAVGMPLAGASASLTDKAGNPIGVAKDTNASGKATFQVPYSSVITSAQNTLELVGKLTVNSNNQIVNNLLTTDSVVLIANVANNVLQKISDDKPAGVGEAKDIIVKVQASTQAELTGKQVTFATTNGEVTPTKATITNIKQENGQWVGEAKTTLLGAIASVATVSAQFGQNTVYMAQKINPGQPKTIVLQSESSVLSPGANTKVIAWVKDANGSPVPNTVVTFKIEKDTSSTGRISQPTAVTDSAGRATVIYTAGSAQTLGGEVQIGAYTENGAGTPSPVYSEKLRLTVAMQSAYITLAQNHLVVKEDGDSTHYYKEFSASVVDTAGNAIANQKISIAVDGTHFIKGFYEWVRDYSYTEGADGGWSWLAYRRWSRDYTVYENSVPKRITTFIECPTNEFPNPVAILSRTGEVLGTTANFMTDSQGKFDFKVRYGRNYANWVRVDLKASTIVSTKDNLTALSFVPPVAAVDVDSDEGKWRPDRVSPYGTDYSSCLNYK